MKGNGNGASAPADTLEAIVSKAAVLDREITRLGETRHRKLTARSFQQHADELAQCGPKERAELAAKIDKAGDRLVYTPSALRRMMREVREPHMTRPPRELRRLSYLLGDREATMAELAQLGAGPATLFALAVELAAQKYPDGFGEVEDADALDRERFTLMIEREQLYAKINETVGVSDLVDLDIDPESGRARTALKMSKGRVSLHPLNDLPSRLVSWYAAHAK